MTLDGEYDDGNIFARILRGEVPAARVFEDDHVLAFMDVFPQSRGHTLVIPKQARALNLLDVEPLPLQHLILGVQRVARAVRAALQPDGLTINQFNGEAGGQSVFHLHFHVIPRWKDAPLGRHGGGMAEPEELAALARLIAAKIS